MCSSIRNWNYSLNKEKSWNRQALPVQPVLLPLYEFFLIKTTKWQLDTSHVCSLVSPFIISLQSLAARMIFLSHFPHNAFLPPCFSSFLILFWYKLVPCKILSGSEIFINSISPCSIQTVNQGLLFPFFVVRSSFSLAFCLNSVPLSKYEALHFIKKQTLEICFKECSCVIVMK